MFARKKRSKPLPNSSKRMVSSRISSSIASVFYTSEFGPEKTWRHLSAQTMHDVFAINAFAVALLGKHLIPLIPRQGRSIFASLSARVGSIGDNRLGGWYSYRASKTAHNMFVKTLSIEAWRKHPELAIVSLHPGTVDTALSEPFTSRYDPEKLFTSTRSVNELSSVLPTDGSEHRRILCVGWARDL